MLPMKRRNTPALLLAALCALLLAALLALFLHGNYGRKLLSKLDLRNPLPSEASALRGWANTLEKSSYDADVAFLGDSMIQRGDFRPYFPGTEICNLGLSRDTIEGMLRRVPAVAAVNPELVFVEGGVNGLGDASVDAVLDQYARLLDSLREALPDARIVVQGCTPLSKQCERIFACDNGTIRKFNEGVRELAGERGLPFVELYDLYERDGFIDPDVTPDGVHLLSEAYAPWAERIRPYIEELTAG